MKSYVRRTTLELGMLAILASDALAQEANTLQDRKQEQDQTIRVATNLVEVRAVVTDKKGRPIKGLTASDFELLENKQGQEISFFSVVTVGGAATAMSAPTGAAGNPVASSSRPSPVVSPARSVVLFVDNIHLKDANLGFARKALKKFIAERLTDDDLTALVTSGGSLGLFSQFTRDRRMLSYAVDKISARGPNRNTMFTAYLAGQVERNDREAIALGIEILRVEEGITGPVQMMENLVRSRGRQVLAEASYQRQVALASLKALTDSLARLPGQRLIVVLSDGFTLLDTGGSYDTASLRDVTSRAAVGGVVIYTIDTRGLEAPLISDASQRGPVGARSAQSFFNAERNEAQNSMNALARDTGGDAIRNSNDIAAGLKRALDENSVYYSMGYYASSEEDPKKFRKLTVAVKGHPEYEVRAQQGYLPSAIAKARSEEAARTPAERLRRAIASPLAVADIGLFATADHFETEDDPAQVTLEVFIDGKKLNYLEDQGKRRFELNLVSFVFNASGAQVTSSDAMLRSNLLPVSYELGKEVGYRYTTRLQLKPGLYQIRVGAMEPETEHMGTASTWVEVPDLTKKRLALSSILLTGGNTHGPLTRFGKENLTLQSGTRQGVRIYKQSDMLRYLLRAYNPGGSNLVYQNEIVEGDALVAQGEWKLVPQETKAPMGIELGRMFPLEGIPPGLYELRVRMREEKSKKPMERSVAFEVIK